MDPVPSGFSTLWNIISAFDDTWITANEDALVLFRLVRYLVGTVGRPARSVLSRIVTLKRMLESEGASSCSAVEDASVRASECAGDGGLSVEGHSWFKLSVASKAAAAKQTVNVVGLTLSTPSK